MRQPTVVAIRACAALLLVCGVVALAVPAGAEVYTIKLSNGTWFESRYQPKQAAWDKTLVTFVDETGTEIALPQALISSVDAESESKGFGRVINTTTVDLGFAPNDIDQVQKMVNDQRAQYGADMNEYYKHTNSQQFVEPDQLGGTPIWGVGFGGGTATPQGNFGGAAPFTTPTAPTPATGTPAPFTTPSPIQPTGAATPPASPTTPQ